MKKIVSILLAVMLLLSLAACGGNASSSGNSGSGSQEPAGSTGTASQESAETNTENTGNTETPEPSEPEGTVVLDNDYFKLTFKGIEEDRDPFFCKMLLNVETKSNEENISFYSELFNLAINGYGIYSDAAESYVLEGEYSIDPGKNYDLELRLYKCVCEAIGIDSIDKIEKLDIVLSGWQRADGKYNHKTYGECSIYPTGLEGSYVQKPREDMVGDETADGENFKITLYWKEGVDFISALKSGGTNSPVVIIENKTDGEYHFGCSDFRINGIKSKATQSGFGNVSGDIKPGGTLVGRLEDGSGYISHLDITKVESITFEFTVYTLSDNPNSNGDILGRFNLTVDPEPIHN